VTGVVVLAVGLVPRPVVELATGGLITGW